MTVGEVLVNGIQGLTRDQCETFLKIYGHVANDHPENLDRRGLSIFNKICDRLETFFMADRVARVLADVNKPTSGPAGLEQPDRYGWN